MGSRSVVACAVVAVLVAAPARAQGSAAAGADGAAESLVYTAHTLGGRSVLFSEDHLVSFEFPSSGLGFDVGAFLEAELGANVGLRIDARYFRRPEEDAQVTLTEVVNASEVIQSVALNDIQSALAPAPVRVDPSLVRAALSLVIHF